MSKIEIRIPHELMDKAFKHEDVIKYTNVLADRVVAAVNSRLKSRGIPIEYHRNSGVRSGKKPRPFANVYPQSVGDTPPTPADWGRAEAYLAAAVGQYSK